MSKRNDTSLFDESRIYEENNETFQDPQWDLQYIQLVDMVYIYWNLHLLFDVYPAERQKEI